MVKVRIDVVDAQLKTRNATTGRGERLVRWYLVLHVWAKDGCGETLSLLKAVRGMICGMKSSKDAVRGQIMQCKRVNRAGISVHTRHFA